MALLTSTEYPMVRAAIDVSLDADALPDATIALDMYAGAADREVLSRDPLAESYSAASDKGRAVRLAAVYFAASLLVSSVPDMTSEQLGDGYRYSRAARDWRALSAELRGRAESAVIEATGAVDTLDMPSLFARAPGGRGA